MLPRFLSCNKQGSILNYPGANCPAYGCLSVFTTFILLIFNCFTFIFLTFNYVSVNTKKNKD